MNNLSYPPISGTTTGLNPEVSVQQSPVNNGNTRPGISSIAPVTNIPRSQETVQETALQARYLEFNQTSGFINFYIHHADNLQDKSKNRVRYDFEGKSMKNGFLAEIKPAADQVFCIHDVLEHEDGTTPSYWQYSENKKKSQTDPEKNELDYLHDYFKQYPQKLALLKHASVLAPWSGFFSQQNSPWLAAVITQLFLLFKKDEECFIGVIPDDSQTAENNQTMELQYSADIPETSQSEAATASINDPNNLLSDQELGTLLDMILKVPLTRKNIVDNIIMKLNPLASLDNYTTDDLAKVFFRKEEDDGSETIVKKWLMSKDTYPGNIDLICLKSTLFQLIRKETNRLVKNNINYKDDINKIEDRIKCLENLLKRRKQKVFSWNKTSDTQEKEEQKTSAWNRSIQKKKDKLQELRKNQEIEEQELREIQKLKRLSSFPKFEDTINRRIRHIDDIIECLEAYRGITAKKTIIDSQWHEHSTMTAVSSTQWQKYTDTFKPPETRTSVTNPCNALESKRDFSDNDPKGIFSISTGSDFLEKGIEELVRNSPPTAAELCNISTPAKLDTPERLHTYLNFNANSILCRIEYLGIGDGGYTATYTRSGTHSALLSMIVQLNNPQNDKKIFHPLLTICNASIHRTNKPEYPPHEQQKPHDNDTCLIAVKRKFLFLPDETIKKIAGTENQPCPQGGCIS